MYKTEATTADGHSKKGRTVACALVTTTNTHVSSLPVLSQHSQTHLDVDGKKLLKQVAEHYASQLTASNTAQCMMRCVLWGRRMLVILQ